MYKKEISLKSSMSNKNASILVQHAMRYDADIIIEQSAKRINAKSIMGVISLGMKEGEHVMLSAVGDDEQAAVEDIVALIESNFNA